MTTKLFVGNLSWSTNDQDLARMFEPFGTLVEAKVITDKETGKSRGFGFVTLEGEGAEKALSCLNGAVANGRTIRVDKATEKRRESRRGGKGSRDQRVSDRSKRPQERVEKSGSGRSSGPRRKR
jgi:cold-inducible RNA-binding protein